MSLEIWPPVAPADRELKAAQALERELAWATQEILVVCTELKRSLEDCYALLAPIDPGSTLVMSTPRNERVKGHITRVGTRIVKGSLNLQLRMLPGQTFNLSAETPLHIQSLDAVHTHLTQAIDLLSLTLDADNPRRDDPHFLSSTLAVLADSLAASSALLRGPPPALSDPTWQTSSCAARRFEPPLPPNLSLHVGLQESCVVVWLRVLEPVAAPVHFGTKLGLAIGTFRRLEHDETDLIFSYNANGNNGAGVGGGGPAAAGGAGYKSEPKPMASEPLPRQSEDVYVREKVRVESADPNLISLYSKLGFLSHMLGQARRNLAAVVIDGPEL